MVIVHIHRVVDIQYLGYTDIKKKFIVCLKLKLNWIMLIVHCYPKSSCGTKLQ